jgi:hypothetical protein
VTNLQLDATTHRSCSSVCVNNESLSSDSEIDDLQQQHRRRQQQQQQQQQHRRRTTPVIDKIRIIERLSTDALDPDSMLEHQQQQQLSPMEDGIDGTDGKGRQVRLSRSRDRATQRRSYSPLLDSSERSHYTVTQLPDVLK